MKTSFLKTIIIGLCLVTMKNSVMVNAAISCSPSSATTNSEELRHNTIKLSQRVHVIKGRYTAESSFPSMSSLWNLGWDTDTNVQGWGAEGQVFLHIYIPATGEKKTFGPYQRDSIAPHTPTINAISGWTNKDVSLSLKNNGDNPGGSNWGNWTSGVDRLEYNIGNGWVRYSNTVNLSESRHYTVEAKAIDKFGHSSSTKTTFGIDKVKPSGTFGKMNGSWSNTNILIPFTPSDALSGVQKWRYSVSSDNGSTWGNWSGYIMGNASGDIPLSDSKTYKIKAEVTDNAGNVQIVTSEQYDVDKVKPSGYFSPNEKSWTNEKIITSFTPTDDRSGVDKWRYAISTDNGTSYGKWSDYVYGTQNITMSTSGHNKIKVEVLDKAGNLETVISGTFSVDATNPVGGFNPPTQGWTNEKIVTSFTPSDSHSGVDKWRYAISTNDGQTYGNWSGYVYGTQNITMSTSGHNKVKIEVVDKVGRVGTVTSGTFFVDATNPSGSFNPPTQGWTSSDITVQFTPSDSHSGVENWRYAISTDNGSTYGPWSGYITGIQNITMSNSGHNKIKVEVKDKVGRLATVISDAFSLDKVSPSGTFSPNSKGWTKGDITTTFTPSDIHSGVNKWRYAISTDNGSTYGNWSNYYGNTPQNITMTVNGHNKIKAEVIDNMGWSSTVISGTYSIDKVSPGGTFSPNSQSWTSGNITTVFTPNDTHSGVNKWRYTISTDNGATYGNWSNYYGNTPQNITMTANGHNKIKAEVVDNMGITTTVYSGTYSIDKVNPITNIVMPSRTTDRTIDITFNSITEIHSGSKEILISNNADFSDSIITTYSHNTPKTIKFTIDKKATPDENYSERTVYFKILDNVNNYTVYTKKIVVEPILPSVEILTPLEDELFVKGEIPNLTWSYKDVNTDFILNQQKAVIHLKNLDTSKERTIEVNGPVYKKLLDELEPGEYEVTVTVHNWKNYSKTSSARRFRYNKFYNKGKVTTIEIAPGNLFKYLKVVSVGKYSNELFVEGKIYYQKSNNVMCDKPINFKLSSEYGASEVVVLPELTSKVVIEYSMENKTNPKNPYVSPVLDNIVVYAK